MSQFVTNTQEYNLISEAELSDILSHFNTDFIMDITQQYFERKLENYTEIPNVINSLEHQFKLFIYKYPYMKDQTQSVREETYCQIIGTLCSKYGLMFNYQDQDVDHYTAAKYIWDFLISGFRRNVVNFFTRYINYEKEGLYHALQMDRYKKSKDTTTLYGKIMYDDTKITIMTANILEVIQYMFGFDISLRNILSLVYDRAISEYMSNILIDPNGTFYQTAYCDSIKNNAAEFISDIRLEIQKLYVPDPSSMLYTNTPKEEVK